MTARTRWSVAALALVALTLGACSSKNAKASDVRKTLKDAGATTEQADCVAEGLDDKLDQKQMNEVAKADELSELKKSLQDIVNETLNKCLVEGESSDSETGDTSDTTEPEGSGDETTTTTSG
jgi:PBP1b-binding outer membrane lipoprotein LpoB